MSEQIKRDIIENRINETSSAQPQITDEQAEEYCRNRCLIMVDEIFFRSLIEANFPRPTKIEQLPSAEPERKGR